ncbi:MAG: Flp family type IVb pilin [Candidatus Jettenia sp.]|uniref:Pilus subunit n=1 Tax=Candidatus Jettenia caeni TaxID=247490 RepID=I3INZ2_9BACT|nr:Flp family type IVb pilin [Candidatus Jettenia sp. AMX1]MBC6927585.1 Flp family type IVb pilin [Candidatus Jettenia sp.]WKZ15895.1 MAG: Flp family type IVb pilin [Candidatus Jettenia caeni]KAA0251561.1 MAG: Flp family type IVb pilin [Candidatus Jettenia sp. AMX1]MCE7881301.1 Flp family type IVb pilin [Candidatus Jettenia sp. AMX1]MCQ3926017.1 Flp family type IVb pilin [Candidatus Jettenia sp.]
MRKFLHFLKGEEGITVIEYGILAAIIAVGIVAAVTVLNSKMKTAFEGLGEKMVDPTK